MKQIHKSKPVTLAHIALKIDAESPGAGGDRLWQHVASSGEFKGYAGGQVQFTLDQQIFDQVITNFRAHPGFKTGEDGFGASNVIPWDFNHASEFPPTEGSVPFTGTPAQGWIQDLNTRVNAEGIVELWALTHWLEPAKTYVKEGRYQWASVSLVFDAVDAVSGEVIGPLLTSVALTNQPFIEGMNRLAAELHGHFVQPAESSIEAFAMLRNLLGLPQTSDLAEVSAEISKIQQWAETGTTPPGIDMDGIVDGFRVILNLPALAAPEEIFVELEKLAARLLIDSGVDSVDGTVATPTPGGQTPPPPPDDAGFQMENTHMELLKVLAEKLGVVAKDDAVTEALQGLLELRSKIADRVGLEVTASTKVVLKATLDDAAVRAKFGPVLAALGVEDPEAALDKIAGLLSDSAKLTEAAPEFAALKVRVDEMDAAEADADVEAAVASAGIAASSEHYAGFKVALTSLRVNNRDEFNRKYPADKLIKARTSMSALPIDAAVLTSKITTSTQASAASSAGAINVSNYPGANKMLRTTEYIRCSIQGADKWDWSRIHEHASKLVRSGQVAG